VALSNRRNRDLFNRLLSSGSGHTEVKVDQVAKRDRKDFRAMEKKVFKVEEWFVLRGCDCAAQWQCAPMPTKFSGLWLVRSSWRRNHGENKFLSLEIYNLSVAS